MLHPVHHVRRMRGGAQSHLIRADDGHFYVVKSLNNPQHRLVLANEWLASSIAKALGLSVPHFDVMGLSPEFIGASPAFAFQYNGRTIPAEPSLAFASRLPVAEHAPIYDYLPEASLELVENLDEFAPMLALDRWLCNCDGRQVIFCRPKPHGTLRVFFIDFGFCFNAGDWTFPDSPLRGVYSRNLVYSHITGFGSFEPWLSRIERFSEAKLLKIMATMPLEWHEPKKTVRLIETLLERRSRVRDLLYAVSKSPRKPFEHWTEDVPTFRPGYAQPALFPQPV